MYRSRRVVLVDYNWVVSLFVSLLSQTRRAVMWCAVLFALIVIAWLARDSAKAQGNRLVLAFITPGTIPVRLAPAKRRIQSIAKLFIGRFRHHSTPGSSG